MYSYCIKEVADSNRPQQKNSVALINNFTINLGFSQTNDSILNDAIAPIPGCSGNRTDDTTGTNDIGLKPRDNHMVTANPDHQFSKYVT